MRQHGFTLFELMIAVAIIAVLAAIAIPSLIAARLSANETATISTVRSICSAQAQFQVSAKVDVDRDGSGEFGTFRELSGAAGLRIANDGTSGSQSMNPPILSGAFRNVNASAEVGRSGYQFRVFLPGSGGAAVGESIAANDTLAGTVDVNLAETTWCIYAWPAGYSVSGNRTFFVNHAGDITAKDDPGATGVGAITTLNAGSAFESGASVDHITGRVAVGTVGTDSFRWNRIN